MTEKLTQKKPYPLGAHLEDGNVRFSFVSRTVTCGVLLYDRRTGKLIEKIPFSPEDRVGNIYCKIVESIEAAKVSYLFYEEDRLVPDERARFFPGNSYHRKISQGKTNYGNKRTAGDLKAGFYTEEFDWGQDSFPRIPYHQMIGYCMHVRGFTKHVSSGVDMKKRGTFAGIIEKIPYLKEIGVTTIELQPAYEFTEIPTREEQMKKLPTSASPGEIDALQEDRLNYWGYKKGFYYAPKAAYASSDDPVTEFKALVKALHESQMELVMQFYFPKEVNKSEIPDILLFWMLEYHVDGFHLMGEDIPADLIAADDALADTKLWYYHFNTGAIYGQGEQPLYPHVAEYNDSWYYDMRRFLKGDGNMLGSVLYHMRHIPEKAGHIHYLTNYYGFTLADLVSYDHKHNEANGENNTDGTDNNCSWNCGEEGATRRQKVRRFRLKQMKNALCLVLLSQSTPLIFMGDEFGNSQKGNNNPYCQDNIITWLDWGGIKKNVEILDFWKMLIAFRKKHPILRPDKELRLTDYIACGYPDLSYHGQNAWSPQLDGNSRHIGIMLCGKYAKADSIHDDVCLYIAMNMHWGSHTLALPKLPKGMKWKLAFSTESEIKEKNCENTAASLGEISKSQNVQSDNSEYIKKLPPRSIAMYISVLQKDFGGKVNEQGMEPF